MKKKLLLLTFLFIGTFAVSQTVTVDSTFESRCQASGRAYFSVTPDPPGSFWSIVSAPAGYIPNPPQTLSFFTALPAGSYVVRYQLGGTIVDQPFTIAGSYMDPAFGVDTIIDAICPGQGEIHVSMSLGRAPYRYRLLHRDSAPGNYQDWANSGIFDSLRAGTYEVQAEDSCGVLKTISGLVVAYPNGGPLGYDYNGAGGIYHSDEATSFPTSCTQTTVAMMGRRNYVYFTQNTGTMFDGNGVGVSDHTDPNQVPLHLIGGLPPYSYTLTRSEAYSFHPPITDTFNDLRPGPPYSSQSATSSTTYFALGRGIEFDVANDLTIYSMSMMGPRTGYNALIVLYDNAGNELYRKWEEQDATNGNDNVASLGWFIPAGTGYRMTVEAINSPGRLESAFYATGVNYPISAGDITITGNADPTTDARILNFFDAVVYSKNTAAIQGPDTTAIFQNVPRTNAYTHTIIAEDGCGEKIYRSITTRIPLEFVGMRRTAAECGIGTDRLFPDLEPYATLHQDVAQHYYTWPWRGNSIGGTLPYTYTVTSDIGYSPDPITTDLAFCNPINAGAFYDPARLRNLDGSQWQPTPGSTVTVNITDACGESITEVFLPPSGNIPIEDIIATNDLEGCAPWRRYRIYHNPYVDTFENFILNINPLTPGGAHARVEVGGTIDYFTPQYNYYQGWSMRGNVSVYPYFLPGDYEITFTGVCSGNVVRDTITVTPSNFSFNATPIQPCSNTPTGRIRVDHSGSELYTSPVDYLYAGNYDPAVNYATATPLAQSLIVGNISDFSGLAPGTYTVLHGTTNGSYDFLMNCAEYKTVTILPYKDPELSLTYDPSCVTPGGNIYASVSNGVPPYLYQWKTPSDPVTVFDINSQSSDTIMGLAPGIYNVRVVDSCGQSTIQTVNTAAPFAIPPVVANNLVICEGSQIRVQAINYPGASYSWTKDGLTFGAPDTNVLIINNAALTDSGDYTVTVSILPGCTSPPATSATIDVVSNINTAIASAVPDRFCEGAGPINLTGGNTTPPTITSGTWAQVNGPTSPLTSTITPNNMNIALVTDISNTDGPPENPYVFRWEIDNGTCMSNAFDTVYIHRNPPSAYAGPSQNLCEQTGTTLAASTIPFGFGYWTQVSGNPITFTDTTDPMTTITGLTWPDTVVLRWTVVNDSANATCVTSQDVSIINYVQTSPSSVDAGPDDTACGVPTYTLQARPVPTDSGTGKWVVIDFPGLAPSISASGLQPNSVITFGVPGLYTLAWEVSNGICDPLADTVELFYINSSVGPDIIVCMDDTNGIRVSADTVPGIPGTWSSSSPSYNFTPNGVQGSDTALVSGFVSGTHTFTYSITSGSCSVSDSLILLASNPPSTSIAGPDQNGLCQDTANLQANNPVDGSGVWTQVSGPNTAIMTDFDSSYNPIQGLIVGTYEFVWTISNQPCTPETDTVSIQVVGLPPSATIISITNPNCVMQGSLTVSGSPAGSYEYSIDSPTGGYQLSPTFTGLDTGTYYAWVRDLSAPVCISRPSTPVTLIDTVPRPVFDTAYFTPVSSCDGITRRGSITALARGGSGTITYSMTGSFTATNTTGYFPNLLAGTYTVKATDSIGCPIDLVTDFNLLEVSCDTIYAGIPITGGIDTSCIPTTFGRVPDSIGSCSGTDGTVGGLSFAVIDSCIIYPQVLPLLPNPFLGDTACIVMCDTVYVGADSLAPQLLCDTTTLIYYPIPTPDTIVTVLPPGKPPVLVCADTSQHLGTSFTYSPCGGPTYGTMNRTLGNCYTYISFFDRIDTACVVICDEYGVCDTTIFIYVPPVTPDTVITTDTVVCVDTNDLLGAMVDSIVTCDGSGMSSNGGGVTIDPITGCVSTSPVFTGGITDTTCVVVCKTVAGVVICDTTIIVTVQPPTPDTIVQLTNGTTTDSCITTSQLVGSTYTYTSCGAPSHGTMSNVDSCYRYVPTTNLLDTACTIICDEYGVCDTTIFIYVPPVTPDTVITTDTVVCVDTNDLLGAMVDSIVTCDGSGMSSNGGGVTIDPITGCVSTIPVFTGGITDTTCVVVCKTVAGVVICDTTIIVTVQPPTPDTIVQLTNGTTTDSCITTSQLVGSTYTYTSCGAPSHGTMSNVDSCYRYVPTTNLLDTACTIICDEYGVCDTTIFIYVPPVTPDTVITTDTVVCVDTNDLLGAMVDSIVTCDGSGMSSNGGGVTIDPITGCVSTIPVFTGGITDTTCVVVCKTVAGVVICDTTIIVTVQPPTPDTIVQLTNGTTTDSCITTSQLVGSTYTYTSCGAPSHGTMSNVDSCYRYVPTTNLLDTACTIICDEYGVCDTTIFIYVPPVTPDTVITTDTVVCVDTNDLLGAMVDSIVTCDGSGMSSNGGGVTIDPITGCVSTIPVFTGGITDTTCVVVCKTVAGVVICDTTIIVTVQPPTPDTIVQLTNGTPVDTCLSQSELLGSMYTYTSCGNPVHGVLTNNTDTCFNYSPITNTLDTACVVICDEYGVCDTTIFIYVPPVTPDTVITTDTVVCVDTNDLLGAMVDSIVTCDGSGMSSNGGGVTIDPITGCVSTIPVFTGGITDTTCVVVCKTVAGVVICDTTIIVTVQPPTPDTIVQLTNGTTTDSCITTSQLVGSTYTYTSCGAPSHGTMSNVDSCYRYVPTTNLLDTACTIICDEYGVCDTTIFIYVPPVTPDTVITTDTVVCVDTNDLLGAMVDSIVTCDGSGMSSNGGGVTIDPITGCVSTIPVFTGGITDTTCVVVCKTVAGVVICDTTIIVTVQPPTPDTIVQLTNGTTTDSCITTSQLVGSTYTYTSCGAPSHGTMSNVDSCYRYVPTTNLLDTACTIICDEYGVCDTTIFIYVPPVTPDTVITTDTVVCVDTNDLLGAMVDSIVTCDGSGMSSNGGGVTIDPITGCVSTSPVFTGGITDTTCVVVCKTVAGVVICDTTIIVTVQPPTPDTIIQLTNGMPVDTCLSQSELLGSMYTYTSCGNPVHGVLTNNTDTCFNYSPITNTLDTACVVICDEYGVCDTTIFIYVPPVTPDTIYSTDTVVCVDTTEMPAGFDTATGCDGMNPTMTRNGGTATIDAQGCVTISPVFVGLTDTTCIIICDTVFGLCDTTIIITKRPSVPDTIVDCIPRDGQANDSSMNTNDLLGPIVSTSVIQLPKHGQFTLTNDTSSSYQTSPFPILDTVTVAICDQYSCCDTFTFIYIPPMTVDTIKQQGGGTVCVDTTEMPAGRYTSIGTCDGLGMTSNGGPVTPLSGGCVSITPDFSVNPIDTTCIILCDTVLPMCECDTTYVISFRPTIPDTFAIQLPKGTNTADTCLTTSELFGTSYTYRRLGAPTPHGPVTTHNDTCINYVQTSTTKYLDTARVLICDECGNCDTTVIIYVPTPDPDTLLVGPVIPVTNVDTCVRLESTYMTGHYINTCDSTGTTSGGVPVTITGLCVRYPVPAPVFTGDTACIIVCDTIRNVTICDTTLIIYLPDTTPPTVVCKDDTVYLDNLGTVMIDTSNVLDTVYDNTLVHSVTVAPTMFNCSNVGVNLVTVTATDTNRNVDSCIARVTVLDTVPPTAICQNITIQLDSNGNASITAFDVDGGSTDNCAIASLVVNQTSFDCSHLGMNTVVLTVTDIHGNVSTCTATVTVEDNISPITYCPSDKQIVVRNTMCSYILPDYTGEASAWDNCLGNGVTITQTPAAGSEVFLENTDTTITLTATDGSGNISTCSFQLYARCVKELNIPQFFSPDGNGQNDTWEIPELANYPNNTVKVFNRWGNLVFEQKGYYTGWDGRSNVDRGVNRLIDNKVLPEGTYFYIIDLGEDGSIEPYVGYMQLKR